LKNRGFTLLELMIAVAILSIFVSMLNPLFTSITRSSKKAQEMSSLDLNIGRSLTLFSRAVRSSKDRPITDTFGGTTRGIYISGDKSGNLSTNPTGNAIVINVPKKDESNFEDEKVIFYIENNKLMINSTTNTSGNFIGVTNPTTLVRDLVENKSYFQYEENIAIISLTVYSNKEKTEEKTVREASVTRINLSF